MTLSELVNVSTAVSKTRSRLKKRALLGDCLRAAGSPSLVVNYLSGTLPQGRIGVGPAMVRDALNDSKPGDEQVPLADVDALFTTIADASGSGSTKAKRELLAGLFGRITDDERRFLAGLLTGEIRQGALEGVLIEGIAEASGIETDRIRRAVMLAADPAPVAVAALVDGEQALDQFRVEPLKAIRPMLAQPSESIADAMSDLGTAALQYKMDGARIQVHKRGDEVRIFTRQLHDVTSRLPEIVDRVREMAADTLILDGEAIALGKDNRPLPFQVTMRRFGRSSDVADMVNKLPMSDFYFDCLYADGAELIDEPLSERQRALDTVVPEASRIPQCISDDEREAAEFLARAFDDGHEGLMAKSLTSTYMAGNRGADWRKIKQVHTLDLVIIAAEWGSGRRKGWLSNLHLAARDDETDEFVMLGKTFKGLTDKTLKWQTDAFLEREVSREEHVVHVRPELVVEIAVNDIQESQQYPAGMALRFARVKRYRKDKAPNEADTVSTVRQLFEAGRG